ncbi:hypothetical protein SAMN05428988_1336 [Chitinophaga sp. YR573]|uniref:hypothetical protein n=1 Tax=Chitinophaga sp. YR573 TaxID=1881040 RepID=UPI0008CB4822|nr:hypothetical protein [Chitinophaga sp. YR573]SEW02175.1 hypothetical protein SAMN05428988_1336 [Chitinophaga sp. YR573]
MSRINVCPACNANRNGVKSRIAFEHTCGKNNPSPLNNDEIALYQKEIEAVQSEWLPASVNPNDPTPVQLDEFRKAWEEHPLGRVIYPDAAPVFTELPYRVFSDPQRIYYRLNRAKELLTHAIKEYTSWFQTKAAIIEFLNDERKESE